MESEIVDVKVVIGISLERKVGCIGGGTYTDQASHQACYDSFNLFFFKKGDGKNVTKKFVRCALCKSIADHVAQSTNKVEIG